MRLNRVIFAACAAGLSSLILAAPAAGANFVVNSTGDAGDATPGDNMCATAGAVCTLRAAIEESNSLPLVSDFISFDPALAGPIALGSTLQITGAVTINGNGSGSAATDTVVDGTDSFRLLSIDAPGNPPTNPRPTISLRDLRLQDGGLDDPVGTGGAGILTANNTTLSNVTVTSNQITGDGDGFGAGIAQTTAGTTLVLNQGSAVTQNTINLDTGAGRGAGVSAAAALSLSDATVSGNTIASPTAARGGGIFASTAFNIERSTVSGNGTGANGSGAGLSNDGAGTKSIVNSTFSGNAAGSGGGGGAEISDDATVTNSTFALNTTTAPGGGGLDLKANGILTTVTVKNTVIGSSTAAGACLENLGADIAPAAPGYNIDAGTSCGFGTADGNQQNTDPLLGPLAANGGRTMTHGLLEGSPALDAADPSAGCGAGIFSDQRFVLRPQGTRCDVGSFELRNFTLGAVIQGPGSGSITSNPAGIACRPDCSETFQPGTLVTLTATPAADSTFAGWSGCDAATGSQCTVSLGTFTAGVDRFVVASFTLNPTTQTPAGVPTPAQKKKKCKKGKKRKKGKCVKKKKRKGKKGKKK